MMKIVRVVLALSFLLVPLHSARAQWSMSESLMSNNSYSRGWVNPYNNTMSNIYQSNMNLITQQAIQRSQLFNSMASSGTWRTARARRLKSISKREQSEAARFAKYQGTMYKERGASDVPAKVAGIFAKNLGANTKEVTPTFKVLLDLYKQRAKQQGAPSNDVARTLAYCISANYYYFTGGTGVPETQVAALRSKIRTALSEDAKFRAMSDAQKRQTSESMVILTHLVALGVEEVAEKAPADKKADVKAGFRKLAGINLQGLLGVDPKRISFDKNGLVIRAA